MGNYYRMNVGLDFGFFNSRISGSVEYYYKVISDLLNYKPLNSYQTITQVIANIGKTQSTGVEVTLNTKNIVTKDFFWSYTTLLLQNTKIVGKNVLLIGNQPYTNNMMHPSELSTPAAPTISANRRKST